MAVLLFASQVMVAKGQWAGDKDPFLSKSLANETVKRVTAETSGGNVSVIGVNTSEARIEVYVTRQWQRPFAFERRNTKKTGRKLFTRYQFY